MIRWPVRALGQAVLEPAVLERLVSLETLCQGFLGDSELENIWSIVELVGFMSAYTAHRERLFRAIVNARSAPS